VKAVLAVLATLAAIVLLVGAVRAQDDIPLPEHPRPDFERYPVDPTVVFVRADSRGGGGE
jgi:hypothetical protein